MFSIYMYGSLRVLLEREGFYEIHKGGACVRNRIYAYMDMDIVVAVEER